MELIILKDGKIFARANDTASDGVYEFLTVSDEDVPAYPQENAGKGKCWELAYSEGGMPPLAWVAVDMPLTPDEVLNIILGGEE